jgi:hypothetical protein
VQCAPVRGFEASRILREGFSCFPSQGVARRARPAFCSERQENFAKNPVTPPRPVARCPYDAEASLFNDKKKEQIMGLDIYAYAVPAEGTWSEPLQFFHYWRKHGAFLDWCEKLAKSRGAQGAKDSRFNTTLIHDDLQHLETDIVTRALYKDKYDYVGVDRAPHDMMFIHKAQLVFGLGRTVAIAADW